MIDGCLLATNPLHDNLHDSVHSGADDQISVSVFGTFLQIDNDKFPPDLARRCIFFNVTRLALAQEWQAARRLDSERGAQRDDEVRFTARPFRWLELVLREGVFPVEQRGAQSAVAVGGLTQSTSQCSALATNIRTTKVALATLDAALFAEAAMDDGKFIARIASTLLKAIDILRNETSDDAAARKLRQCMVGQCWLDAAQIHCCRSSLRAALHPSTAIAVAPALLGLFFVFKLLGPYSRVAGSVHSPRGRFDLTMPPPPPPRNSLVVCFKGASHHH